MVFEQNSGLYDKSDPKTRQAWLHTFDKSLGLPKLSDANRIKREVNWGTKVVVFDTDHERLKEIGREYKEQAIPFGTCLFV